MNRDDTNRLVLLDHGDGEQRPDPAQLDRRNRSRIPVQIGLLAAQVIDVDCLPCSGSPSEWYLRRRMKQRSAALGKCFRYRSIQCGAAKSVAFAQPQNGVA